MFCSFQAKKETPAREKEKAGACPQKFGESPKNDRKKQHANDAPAFVQKNRPWKRAWCRTG